MRPIGALHSHLECIRTSLGVVDDKRHLRLDRNQHCLSRKLTETTQVREDFDIRDRCQYTGTCEDSKDPRIENMHNPRELKQAINAEGKGCKSKIRMIFSSCCALSDFICPVSIPLEIASQVRMND